jgi:pimeloyl-ACP methyl ester carboxylesterase
VRGELVEVVSADGSVIGVERLGNGPALVVVHGGTADRSRWAPVREQLAERSTLYLVDRRGRASSLGEADGTYRLGLEAEDVLAVAELIDGPYGYLGHSYGALVGLEALARTDRISKAFLYEPAFDAGGLEVAPASFLDAYSRLIDEDRRDDALDLFYRDVIGVDPGPLHALPIWQVRRAAAHTLVREGIATATFTPDPARYTGVRTACLLLLGTTSPPVFGEAARAAAAALPDARIVEAQGQGHTMIDADPAGFVRLVTEFFDG